MRPENALLRREATHQCMYFASPVKEENYLECTHNSVRILRFLEIFKLGVSMAEITGLVIGAARLLPVIVEIIQDYKKVRQSIISVLSCTRELKIIEFDLKVQEQRFLNELEILLQKVEMDGRARDMIDDTAHPLWHNREMDARIRQILHRSYSLCAEIVASVKSVLQELGESLKMFEDLRAQRQKVRFPERLQIHIKDS